LSLRSRSGAIVHLAPKRCASSFGEFADEVRAGTSEIVFLLYYREPVRFRLLKSVIDIMRPYPELPGRERWSDRVLCQSYTGVTRSLSEMWSGEFPAVIRYFERIVRLADAREFRQIARQYVTGTGNPEHDYESCSIESLRGTPVLDAQGAPGFLARFSQATRPLGFVNCATLTTMPDAAPVPQVSMVSADQDSEAAIVLGRAFVNDSLLKLILSHVTVPVERARILSVVFALALTRQRLSGQPVFGIIREGRVAAVAITEGAQRHSTNAPLLKGLGMLFRMISAVGLVGTLRAVRFSHEIGKNRPREPHLYLSVIGVDPEQQGRHHGIALLDHLRSLLNVHSDWTCIYLETATEDNLGYYARAGYQQLGEMHPLGVTMWRMMLTRA